MTSISVLWPTLDSNVQQWILQNPGATVLPRTYVNRIEAGMGECLSLSEHGEHWLSPEEMHFLKMKRAETSSTDTPLLASPVHT
ncbi:hypothetical protein [Arthrobacter sp. L77]|uniref:hypothetical protein n=1 Tax=Arthrobacter sp. L77 TaxID=1496689 RepID=UPI0006892758|nr:hypothetical protein [Arthrobacter sp. L77]